MRYKIHQAVVIGSGTMGAAIAAHLANAGIPVTLLDIVPNKLTPEQEAQGLTLELPEVRNSIVQGGLKRAIEARPASFFSEDQLSLVKTGNLEDNFDAIRSADWVIEAVVENLKIKRDLMARIDAIRAPHTIVSTNTSGIPVTSIAEGLSEGFRQHFLGTHFFNPPRYLKLLEIIPTADTLSEVTRFISHFGEYRLGKGIVLCKDTPNFIGNRMAFGSGAFALDYILQNGYTIEEVDNITGPLIGRPKTATFRLIDLVGVDVWDYVGKNLAKAIPHDAMAMPYLNSEAVNSLIEWMMAQKYLGNKTKVGFYKEVRTESGKEFWSLNLQTRVHEAPAKVRFESIGKARGIENLAERLKTMLSFDDRAAQLVRALTYQSLAYAAYVIPEIADTPKPIDDAMRWGFGHEAGPFEIWDMLGVAETAQAMRAAGFAPAEWVETMLANGCTTFYQYEHTRKIAVYNPQAGAYQPLETPGIVSLVRQKQENKIIARNPGASLIDLGDGIACVEFHTKMNALDDDIFNMLIEGMNRAETDFDGLVIGGEAENFSAGANLFMVVMAAQSGMWDQLDAAIRKLQNLNMRMRYFPKPVIVAPLRLTLGGGAEITMHASRVVAGVELYAGLVEVGAGVIPAGGGTKEMVRRLLNPTMRTKNADPLPHLQRIFEQVGMAKVSTSAEEARQMGILTPADRTVMNLDHLITEARREARHLADSGYAPPPPEKIYAAGRDALAALRVGIYMFEQARQISAHDALIANKLAYIMTGGELSAPAWLDEQYFLDLEREAFLSLCGEEKTRQRMWNLLQTGKPLRN